MLKKRKKVKCKTPRRKHTGKLHDIGFDNDFLYITPKAQTTKAKMDRTTSNLKNFCAS